METVSRKFEDTSLVPANLRALILFGCALSDPKHQEKSEREPAASRALFSSPALRPLST